MRLRKGLASRCWENLILAMLGEQFMVGEEICGAVVSIRFQASPHLGWANGKRSVEINVQSLKPDCLMRCLTCVVFL